jgi:hypothetical protein
MHPEELLIARTLDMMGELHSDLLIIYKELRDKRMQAI